MTSGQLVYEMREEKSKTGKSMEKCGICGKMVPQQPMVKSDGNCGLCGAHLTMMKK